MKKRIIAAVLALGLMLPAVSASAETWTIHTHTCNNIEYYYLTHNDAAGKRHQVIQLNDYWVGLNRKCDAFVKYQRYYNAKGWITVGSREFTGLN